jgi:hypothetical protein
VQFIIPVVMSAYKTSNNKKAMEPNLKQGWKMGSLPQV